VSDAWTSERTGPGQSTGPAPRRPADQETTMSPSTPASPIRLLPVAQAAEQVSTTAATLYELVASHAIPSDRIGRAIRPPEAALHRLQNEPAEYLAQADRAADRRSISTAQQRPTSDAVPMPDRRHREQQASEPRKPNSCETRDPDTCMQLRLDACRGLGEHRGCSRLVRGAAGEASLRKRTGWCVGPRCRPLGQSWRTLGPLAAFGAQPGRQEVPRRQPASRPGLSGSVIRGPGLLRPLRTVGRSSRRAEGSARSLTGWPAGSRR
jgi:excisionase family DNA binding protein